MNRIPYFLTTLFLLTILVNCSRNAPDYSFIRFKDASPCVDYGDLTPVIKPGVIILKLPFFIRLNEEGRITKESYPATESQINEYFSSELEKHYQVLIPNRQYPHVEFIIEFFRAVLDKAAQGVESPHAWGHTIPEGVIDKETYIYFPFGIERESKAYMNARFYVLIANNQGKVIFTRCLPYNPHQWSLNIGYFKRDVKGKLPLIE